MFIDRIKIIVSAGKGGDGCISFRREKLVPRGGPNGGDGGKGGDVLLKVSAKCSSLSHLRYISHFKAGRGEHGKGNNLHGKAGKDLTIEVPPGTVVYKSMGCQELPPDTALKSDTMLLTDLISVGESIIVAKGGKGGRGNARFKTSTNQAPRIREFGSPGEKVTLLLELKLIADIGLVGYPNAGKSTLLASISSAKPKIASYPFTTLTPNLGVLYIDNKKITIADIPGIIEGAHQGKGLGLEFLRHIERTNLLIFILDITQDPVNDYNILRNELKAYNPLILKKPSIMVLNKIDLVSAYRVSEYQNIRVSGALRKALPISALKGTGIDKLLLVLKDLYVKKIDNLCV